MFAPKPLSVSEVFKSLTEIAKSSGASSQAKKIGIIKRMLTACKGTEPKYLVRSLEGKLRIGMAEKSVLTALSQAFITWEFEKNGKRVKADDIQQADEIVKDVCSQLPNYEVIIEAILKDGILNLKDACKLTPGIPLKPMLAKPTKSITEVLDRFNGEEFTCEYKYDGERAQVHATEDGKIRVYSRNMEDMSQRYPDIVSIVPHFMPDSKKSFILDCEAVAWDREQRKILPFQVLSTRKRKDVEEGSIKVRVHLFAFDLLYLDGEPLLQKSLLERRELIKNNFTEVEGEFAYAKSMNSDNIEEIQAFLDQSVKDSCEGLMVKMLNGTESGYEPSKRSRNWLKLKKDYLSGVGDSLDLVVLGAYYGRGKRTNVYGGFLLGCYNADSEDYETVCKIGTGFSEANLEEFHKQLSTTVVSEPKSYISYDPTPSSLPDVWFEPTTVWEVLTADLSLSPIYKAGIQQLGRGISLRFPRFIRVREDKKPEDATTSEQIVDFYQRQASLTN
ncbi:DNA ligase (ATP) CDC9 [Sugiyamaella lignohabitans]|uniref:DNA ligase n=1 Tax=Sugiyamaella lignohabitans TaxID=796027 RepID=A0A167FCC8_9ASCO|nr:DNA ligase (ATP) CDC9 [Sugiyamaella lignohabitans]ANB15112.1 DNA ligase (ATP) CDC9 [Sugiyamaella lignohabitans]